LDRVFRPKVGVESQWWDAEGFGASQFIASGRDGALRRPRRVQRRNVKRAIFALGMAYLKNFRTKTGRPAFNWM
jgi:hypothetical protein